MIRKVIVMMIVKVWWRMVFRIIVNMVVIVLMVVIMIMIVALIKVSWLSCRRLWMRL